MKQNFVLNILEEFPKAFEKISVLGVATSMWEIEDIEDS